MRANLENNRGDFRNKVLSYLFEIIFIRRERIFTVTLTVSGLYSDGPNVIILLPQYNRKLSKLSK